MRLTRQRILTRLHVADLVRTLEGFRIGGDANYAGEECLGRYSKGFRAIDDVVSQGR